MNYYTTDNSPKWVGWIATIAYIVAIVLLLLLVKVSRLDPLLLRYGEIEVVFEQTFADGGAATQGADGAASNEIPDETAPVNNVPPIATQNTQPATEVPVSGTNRHPTNTAATSAATQPERTVDPDALFSPSASTSGSGTSATSTSTGSGSGVAGSGRSDVDFDLTGRNPVGGLIKPEYNIDEAGKIIIDIKVDQTGKVYYAQYRAKGSTTQNTVLREAARQAALATRFTASDNTVQEGTITYIFKLQ